MIMQNIEIFTSAPKAHFYDQLFLNLDLSEMPEYDSKTGRRGYSNHAKLCAFIVMKCECFSYITDLLDFLQNNLIIAHYCGFDITRPLPSYWTLDRFLNQIDHDILDRVLQTQVEKLTTLGMILSDEIQHCGPVIYTKTGMRCAWLHSDCNFFIF